MRYFQYHEFACRCGAGCDAPLPTPLLLAKLDELREQYGKPIVITSGVRCPRYNAQVGGKPDSAHLTGEAADLACETSRDRRTLLHLGHALFRRMGIGSLFLHVDVSTAPTHAQDVTWLY